VFFASGGIEHAVALSSRKGGGQCASWQIVVQKNLRRSAMESSKPAQNIQDSFLNTARKERLSITIYLLSGVKLTGRIRSFDKYSVVLEANGQEQLIFKHAISTIVMGRTGTHSPHLTHPEAKPAAAPGVAAGAAPASVSAASASGTEG
jgi:host factor-I protein